ncbi:MAG: DUF3426 domain-containing protein [Pseudomonadota bacterium]
MTEDAIQTRCPACHTVFEVDKTILQRASGKVRCGDCLHVFDALANADTDIPILRKPEAPDATVAITPPPTQDLDTLDDSGGTSIPADDADIFQETFDPSMTGTSVDFEFPEVQEDAQASDNSVDYELGADTDVEQSEGNPDNAASLDFDLGATEAPDTNEVDTHSATGIDFDFSETSSDDREPSALEMIVDELSASDIGAAEPKLPDDRRDETGRFLFSDDIPDDLLDAELGAEEQAPSVVAPIDLPASDHPSDEALGDTMAGDDWDDLLSELGDEPDEAGDQPLTAPNVTPFDAEIDVGEPLNDEQPVSETVASPVDDSPSLADALFESAELSLEDAVADKPVEEPAITADSLSLVDAPDPSTDALEASEVEHAQGSSNDAIADIALTSKGDAQDSEDDTDPDEDRTRVLGSAQYIAASTDEDATQFLNGDDKADGDEATRRLDPEEEIIKEVSDTFDTHALSDMLAASEVFLNADDHAPDDNNAAASDTPQDDAGDSDSLVQASDNVESAPTQDAEVNEDNEAAVDRPQDVDDANVSIPDDAPVGEEIVLATAPEPDPAESTPEDIFAESMILMSEGKQRRRGLWSALSIALIIGLAVQAIHLFRGEIATTTPWGNYLKSAYATVGLPLEERWDINSLCIQRSGSSLNDTSLEIETVFENRADRPVPLPVIKVDITDNFDDVIATATVAPTDYLKAGSQSKTINQGQRVSGLMALAYNETRADKFELSLCYRDGRSDLRCGAAICGNP